MLAEYLTPNLLLVRYKPLPDELLSSWLVRLAWSNGQHLERFWRKRLGITRHIWHTDLDRGWLEPLISSLAAKTSTSLEEAAATTLRAYEGSVVESCQLKGTWNWILPIGRKVRTWSFHGQQYCPICLREDKMPYFRRRWRLSFSVVCPNHGIRLRDACPTCKSPVTYHESEIGVWLIQEHSPLTKCPRCGGDYRRVDRHAPTRRETTSLVAFQQTLYNVMDYNFPLLGAKHPSFPHLFFNGFHQILHTLGANGDARRLRDYMITERGEKPFSPAFRTVKERFEELRLKDRVRLMKLVQPLLQDWPERFIDACHDTRLALIHLVEFHNTYPFWYEQVVKTHFNHKLYHPTQGERIAAALYLNRFGHTASNNLLNGLLGMRFAKRTLSR